jgi:hypothetical protein
MGTVRSRRNSATKPRPCRPTTIPKDDQGGHPGRLPWWGPGSIAAASIGA